MKKYLILSAVFILALIHGKGQTKSIEYGFEGGININSANGTAINKTYRNPLLGYNIGGHIKFYTSKSFGIKAILRFEQNGWTYRSLTFEDNTGTTLAKGDAFFKLNYLNLPVLAEYTFGNKVKFNLGGGLFFGVLLGNQVITKINQPIPPNPMTITRSSSDLIKATNFGVSLSAGMQIPISNKVKLGLYLHENYGLSNINKSEGPNKSTIKTNALAINTGLVFLW